MRIVKKGDFEKLVLGLSFFGCGGGGRREEAMRILSDMESVVLLDPEELDPDELIASPYSCGTLEEEHEGHSKELCAIKTLEDFLGSEISAFFPTELGPYNVVVVFALARELGRDVLDADGAGRSVPEVHHSIPSKLGISACPMGLCTSSMDEMILKWVKNERNAETAVRKLVEAFGNVGVCDHPMKVKNAGGSLVLGSISKALEIGELIYERDLEGILRVTGARIVTSGRVEKVESIERGGFTEGFVVLNGKTLMFKNENMEFIGEVHIVFPDLLVMLDESTLHPVENPPEEGEEVLLLSLKADERWYI